MPGYLSASVTTRSMDRRDGGSANGITGQRSSNRVQSWVVYIGNVFKGMKYWDNICRHHLEVENFKLFSL